MKRSKSMKPTQLNRDLQLAKSLSTKQMRKMWEAEIAKAWHEMQTAIAVNQSDPSY